MAAAGLRADLVMEGGGVKGTALVGVLSVLEEAGYQFMNLAGTSAGAIVAALVAAGYTAQELKQVMDGLDYSRLRDRSLLDRLPVAGPLLSLIFEKGIYEGDYFFNLMDSLLREKGVRTFADLVMKEFQEDERYRFRLRVIAADISLGRLLVLPQDIRHYGIVPDDLSVALAVRMSMSIPLFYEPVTLRDAQTGQVSYIIDGGVLSNFPVWLFDTQGGVPEWATFGLKLVEPEEGRPHRIRGPVSLLTALFGTMMEAHDARYIEDQDFARTIPIPTLGVRTTEFDLSPERREALYQAGRGAAQRFLGKWDFSDYILKYRGDASRHGRHIS
ncbi:MAG: patatin-like phospholipase family protein [Chloroflexota bacterium]